jgi:uncharacterized protein
MIIKNQINFFSKFMKRFFLLGFALMLIISCKRHDEISRDYPIHPVPFTKVRLCDNFWAPRLKINKEVTIPVAFKQSEKTGRIDNFKIAGKLEKGSFCSKYSFDDSDVYKNIEGASYSLEEFPDPKLEAYLDSLISYIAAAQEKDGYIYTNRTIDPEHTLPMSGTKRWERIEEGSHELYNLGHLYEAAVAYYQATGKKTLLNVAIKSANLIDRKFGWGKIEKAPGHQEIEIGLVKLYRVTGNEKYLKLAKFFLDVRGPGGDRYNQMHKKVIDQDSAVGHAVRAQYMYSAMADVAALTGDEKYIKAIDRLWKDVTDSKTYITGGIGSQSSNEGFGPPYDLPNLTAYCETCAAVANALWNQRMFLLHGDSKYYDVLEKVLYNGLLSGVSLSGDHFFYPNPLASEGKYQRKEWFGCACCPVNISRFIPSVPGYIYATKEKDLYVNLYISDSARFDLDGKPVEISQQSNYPWDGNISLNISPGEERQFTLMLRIPGWAMNQAFPTDLYTFVEKNIQEPILKVNGQKMPINLEYGYAKLDRTWKNGDKVELTLPMPVREVKANSRVLDDAGKIALQRGPIVYCLEWIDQPGKKVSDLSIGDDFDPVAEFHKDLLNGVEIIRGTGIERDNVVEDQPEGGTVEITAIPYYSWANRGAGEMEVWIPLE